MDNKTSTFFGVDGAWCKIGEKIYKNRMYWLWERNDGARLVSDITYRVMKYGVNRIEDIGDGQLEVKS